MSTAIANPVLRDLTRDRLRDEHKVRTLRSEEEGTAFDKLPNAVYGFTYSPATETPLFSRENYHCFEVHKLRDGTGRLLAYCSPEEAQQLHQQSSVVEITAFPASYEKATVLVSIPMHRILNSLYKPVRRDGNAIPLRITSEQ